METVVKDPSVDVAATATSPDFIGVDTGSTSPDNGSKVASDAGKNDDTSAGGEDTDKSKEEGQHSKDAGQQESSESQEGKEDGKANAEDEKSGEARLYAGQYKTTEELEKAFQDNTKLYDLSSKEGKRLNLLLKESRSKHQELVAELEKSKLEAELGSFQEKTQEELSQMDAEQRLEYKEKFYDFKRKKERLEAAREQSKTRKNEVLESWEEDEEHMNKSANDFPMYSETVPLMHALMDEHKWMEEDPRTGVPRLLYFAAMGIKFREKLMAEAEAKTKSQADVNRKANEQARRSGTSGATGAVSSPKAGRTDKATTDEDPVIADILSDRGRVFG